MCHHAKFGGSRSNNMAICRVSPKQTWWRWSPPRVWAHENFSLRYFQHRANLVVLRQAMWAYGVAPKFRCLGWWGPVILGCRIVYPEDCALPQTCCASLRWFKVNRYKYVQGVAQNKDLWGPRLRNCWLPKKSTPSTANNHRDRILSIDVLLNKGLDWTSVTSSVNFLWCRW